MADINSISPSIRDFLLNRNLILADTITDNGMSGYAGGLGKLAQIETPPSAVQASDNITTLGDLYRGLNIGTNPYQSENEPEEIQIARNKVKKTRDFKQALKDFPKQHRFVKAILNYLNKNPDDWIGSLR